jgi:hypothetical protein
MTELADWAGFYGIVGTAAATLMGLQFVAMTLIASRPRPLGAEAGAAFSTPTIVHFAVPLFLSAVLHAPWHGVAPPAVIWGLTGFTGLGYAVLIARKMRAQNVYTPVFEDWLFHAYLPFVAYGALVVAAVIAVSHARIGLFGEGGALLLLLFIGIHNSWDGVTYQILQQSMPGKSNETKDKDPAEG